MHLSHVEIGLDLDKESRLVLADAKDVRIAESEHHRRDALRVFLHDTASHELSDHHISRSTPPGNPKRQFSSSSSSNVLRPIGLPGRPGSPGPPPPPLCRRLERASARAPAPCGR